MRLEILRVRMYHIPSGDHHCCRWKIAVIFIYEIIIIIIRNQMTLLDLQSRLFKGSFF